MANIFKNAGIEVLAARTTLYTCPVASTAVIHALYLSNVDGTSPVDADIEITIDGGTTYRYIGKTLAIPEDSTLILDKPINLESGDILAITASVANHLEAVAAILEIS
jgi:hypothetical protein